MQIPYRKPGKFSQLKPDPLMTKEKFQELQDKLEHLKKIQPDASAEVARLAELGDFSENAEYQLAKGRLRGILGNITRLDNQINQAEIIATDKTDTIQIGHTVKVEVGGKEKIFQILGSSETKPELGIISHSSPIGYALIGHKVGETVAIKLANKDVAYTILKIS